MPGRATIYKRATFSMTTFLHLMNWKENIQYTSCKIANTVQGIFTRGATWSVQLVFSSDQMKEFFKELRTMPSSSFQLQDPVTVPFPKTVSLLLTRFIIIYDTRRLINDKDLLLFHFLTFCTAHPPHQRIGRNGHGPHRSGVKMKIISIMSIIPPH